MSIYLYAYTHTHIYIYLYVYIYFFPLSLGIYKLRFSKLRNEQSQWQFGNQIQMGGVRTDVHRKVEH